MIVIYYYIMLYITPAIINDCAFTLTHSWAFQALMLSTFDNESQEEFLTLYSFDDESVLLCHVWLGIWLIFLQIIILVGIWPPVFSMKLENDKSPGNNEEKVFFSCFFNLFFLPFKNLTYIYICICIYIFVFSLCKLF